MLHIRTKWNGEGVEVILCEMGWDILQDIYKQNSALTRHIFCELTFSEMFCVPETTEIKL